MQLHVVFFFQYLLAKNFSIEDVGIFNTLFSIFNLLIIVLSFGIPKAILKISSHFYSNYENQNLLNFLVFAVKKQIFIILIICIILFVVFFYFPLNNISEIENNMILTFIVSIPFLAIILSFSEFFKATKHPNLSILFWKLLITLITVILILFLDYNFIQIIPLYYLISCLIVFVFGIVLIIAFYKQYLPKFRNNISNIIVKDFKFSKNQFYISRIFEQIIRWSPTIILGIFSLKENAALFTIATQISFVISLILQTSNILIVPYISSYYVKGDTKSLMIFINKVLFFICLACLPLFFLMFFYSDFLLGFFGQEYVSASITLKILVVSTMINAAFGPVGLSLQICNYEKVVKNINILSAIILLISMSLLTPIFSIEGVAFSVLLSVLIKNISLSRYCNKLLGIKIIPKI